MVRSSCIGHSLKACCFDYVCSNDYSIAKGGPGKM